MPEAVLQTPTHRHARPEIGPAQRANALRVLALDAVEQAGSGHPGMPMGMADVAEVLWTRYLRHDPGDPGWWDRDRFVLSNGHGSMLLYGLLHLTGYDLPMTELRRFRQLGSRTPGHPERGVTPGVETSTGPLGQGLANGVGMALAEKLLAAEFNRPAFPVVDHFTYVFLGDGCLMEGLSQEAVSIAGVLELGKLVCFWDDNGISIDGPVRGWFRDDTPSRFAAAGWHVVPGVDGHDPDDLAAAIAIAKSERRRPKLVCCRTVIGKGAPTKAGTHEAHGAPLGPAEARLAREALGWTHPPFEVPAEIRASWDGRARGAAVRREWQDLFDRYTRAHPALADELRRRMSGELPTSWSAVATRGLERAVRRPGNVATRKASQEAIEVVAAALPELLGGSADLTGSNLTRWKDARPVGPEGGGRYVHWGVREFGMSAAMNGLALHGGFLPFGGTFLVFSDYARSALRMAALMKLQTVHVLTHDSIGVGEDGPTHQPVEHAATLRLVPGLDVWRPCDAAETFAAWRVAVERRDGPSALLLSRQALPPQPREGADPAELLRGAYVLAEAEGGAPRAVILATGSEVQLAMEARRLLAAEGLAVRVVSMPSTTVFDRQDGAWKAAVLPAGVPRVAVEAGITDFWRKYVGLAGEVIGLDRFGESGPAEELFRHFGFTAAHVAEAVRRVVSRVQEHPGEV